MNIRNFFQTYHLYIALFAVFISLFTWGLQLLGWVEACIYCETQRILIGVLGAIALLPQHKNTPLRYLCYVLVLWGADVASTQVMMSFEKGTFPSLNAFLASCAFMFFIILMLLNHFRFNKT